jgi:hypothetical protein
MEQTQRKDPLVEVRAAVRADRRKFDRISMTGLVLKPAPVTQRGSHASGARSS